jgi:hypothetical protein
MNKILSTIREVSVPLLQTGQPLEISTSSVQLSYSKAYAAAFENKSDLNFGSKGKVNIPSVASMLTQLCNISGMASNQFTQEVYTSQILKLG